MIFGGKWKRQDKKTSGVWINFISNSEKVVMTPPTPPDNPNPSKDSTAILGIAVIGKILVGNEL